MPDLLGYKLNNALEELTKRGFKDIIVTVTAPPRESGEKPCQDCRVLKMIYKASDKIEIIVCNYPNS